MPCLLVHSGPLYNLVRPNWLNLNATPKADTPFLVPIVGMLCGASVAGIVVAVSFILREIQCVHNVYSVSYSMK